MSCSDETSAWGGELGREDGAGVGCIMLVVVIGKVRLTVNDQGSPGATTTRVTYSREYVSRKLL